MKAQELRGVVDLRHISEPLFLCEREVPEPGPGEIMLRVAACGVCHTELDEIEGRTPPPRYPVIPGHQVVGRLAAAGSRANLYKPVDRLGVAWIFSACGTCDFCRQGLENLCDDFRATGRDADGGYAEYMVVPESFANPIPDQLDDVTTAPLLCAGAIGYRSLRLADLHNGDPLGLTGFGGSGHLVLKLARHLYPDSPVFIFARNPLERQFGLDLGADWAGDTTDPPPLKLQAVIDTTPVWKPVLSALENLRPGGRLVINAIRKEGHDAHLLSMLDYPRHLWMEKEIKSVANVCRSDVRNFLDLAVRLDIRPQVELYPLEEANRALVELKTGAVQGAKVLTIA
jgi:propanol-preferring alcohol dehydrogenase